MAKKLTITVDAEVYEGLTASSAADEARETAADPAPGPLAD